VSRFGALNSSRFFPIFFIEILALLHDTGISLVPTTEFRYMRQSEFDKINAALDRAEFALDALRKKAEELEHKRATSKSPEDILAMNLEAAEIMQQLQKISNAIHVGNPAPHLRLVSDTE
jgi:hypothetical protein